jgi:predicted HAD superfamily Cof-like phosphohydrolase
MSMPIDVLMFLSACDQKPSEDNAELYSRLIAEEYQEFMDARADSDEAEQLDACMDMIWVILGYAHMKGYDINGAWNSVVQTNMAKVDPVTGKVRRREDGKILKPEGWAPPDMTKFLPVTKKVE